MLAGAVFQKLKMVSLGRYREWETYQERENREPRRDFEPVLEEFLSPLAIVIEVSSFGGKSPGGFIAFGYHHQFSVLHIYLIERKLANHCRH